MSRLPEPRVDLALARDHGLTDAEYASIERILGRTPSYSELGIFSVMWSEHCSYKSSKKYLKRLPTSGPQVLQGPGENAGVVSIGDGLAVVFKIESRGQVVLRYVENPNGSLANIAGVTNARGNVMGLMPHPEHAVEPGVGGEDGAVLLGSLLDHCRGQR